MSRRGRGVKRQEEQPGLMWILWRKMTVFWKGRCACGMWRVLKDRDFNPRFRRFDKNMKETVNK